MGSLKSEDWSFMAKWGYKYVRPFLKRAVKNTATKFDDEALKVLDMLAGYK